MKRRPFYAATLAAALVTATSPTIATADNTPPVRLSISPSTAHPGQQVTLELNALCHEFVVSSPVFYIDRKEWEDGVTRAYSRVRADAQAGNYVVSVQCHHFSPPTFDTYTVRITVAKASPYLVSVSPSSARPGQPVRLDLYRYCSYGVTFASPVLTIVQPDRQSDYGETRASAMVNADVEPGRYEISATCLAGLPPRPTTYTAPFTVTNAKEPAPNRQPPVHQVKQVPKGAAQTGGGGTASLG